LGGAARPRYWRLLAWLIFEGTLAALIFAANLASPAPPPDAFYRYSTGLFAFVAYALTLGFVLLIARGIRTKETFALHRPPSWPRTLVLILKTLASTYLLVIFVAIFVALIFVGALDSGGPTDQGTPTFWDGSRVPQFALSLVAVAVLAPVVEELEFRGLGFALLRPFGERAAIVGTAVMFGLGHGFVGALPVFIIIGLGLGWLRARTGSVYPGMVMHGFINTAVTVLSISLG